MLDTAGSTVTDATTEPSVPTAAENLSSGIDILKDLSSEIFWAHIGIAALFGLIGGIGVIFLSRDYIPSKWVVRNGKKVKYVFGSIRELVIGSISGVLTTLMFYNTVPANVLIHLSMLAGLGSSAYLKSYLDKNLEKSKDKANEQIEGLAIKVDAKLDEEEGGESGGNTRQGSA